MERIRLRKILDNTNILEVINDPVIIIDKEKNIRYYNYQYMNLVGLSPRHFKDKRKCFECFTLDICNNNCILDQCRQTEQPVQLREVGARGQDGTRLSLWISTYPLFGEDEQFAGMAIILRDMTVESGVHSKYKVLYGREKDTKVRLEDTVKERTEQLRTANIQLKLINRKLEKLSVKDDLTDLFNYRYFSEKIDELFQDAQKNKTHLSCILLDVDYFKSVNDHHSHQFGDFVLYKLGAFIGGVLRENDILARYGGDEFVILLPKTDYDEAISLAKNINETVKKEDFRDGEFFTKVTASMGVSSYPRDDIKVKDQLVKFADEALYKAKNSGRDIVFSYKDIKDKKS